VFGAKNVKRALSLALIAAAALSLAGCKFTDDINKLVISPIDLSAIKDGNYEGAQDNKLVTAKVSVQVQSGKIAELKLLEHSHGPGHGADAILDRVVATQSLQVDSVSGATYSSKVVLKAIEIALSKGL
jgi:uncharacterized protein with FMN-binding domain